MPDESFELHISSPSRAETRELFSEIKLKLDEGTVAPALTPNEAAERSIADIFSHLVVTGINLGVFTAIFNVAKVWLDGRPKAEVTLTLPDGFQMKVSNLSLEEANKMYEQHAAKIAPPKA